jgi:ADP-L-glycero-D-manno-heptose 6-epimerase
MILVTGGAGFIGSNLVAALVERGERVVVCDRLGPGDKWRNLVRHEIEDFISPGELRGYLDARGTLLDSVVHLGAISETTATDGDLLVANNFKLSQELWDWCAEQRKPFVYASSAATYGDGAAGFDDDMSVAYLARLRPLNAYGWSKQLPDRRGRRGAAVPVAPSRRPGRRPEARFRVGRRLRRGDALAARDPGGHRPVQPRDRPGAQLRRVGTRAFHCHG